MQLKIKLLNPLEQFQMFSNETILWYMPNPTTNFEVFLMINFWFTMFFFNMRFTKKNAMSFMMSNMLQFMITMMTANLRMKKNNYFPYICNLFFFILSCNLVGMIPYTYTITSSLMVTFFLSLTSFMGMNLMGMSMQKYNFFSLFVPKGVPSQMLPFLVIIELISFFSSVLSLAMRLFANLMSGHTLLKMLLGFLLALMPTWNATKSHLFWFFPWLMVALVTCLEFAIGFLQAYVFTMLVTMYLNDTMNLH